MAKREKVMTGAVELGGRVFTPGQEDELEELISKKMVDRLRQKNVLDGDWSPKGSDPAPRMRRRLVAIEEEKPAPGARGAGTARTAAPTGTGAAGAGATGTNAGAPGEDDYEARSVDELAEIAKAREITVTRGDGKDGAPLKADYVNALRQK